jgi:hypothetical protein
MNVARSLKIATEFAPSDFAGCVSSGYTDEKLESIIADIEQKGDDGSFNYKNNLVEIAKYRTKKSSEK